MYWNYQKDSKHIVQMCSGVFLQASAYWLAFCSRKLRPWTWVKAITNIGWAETSPEDKDLGCWWIRSSSWARNEHLKANCILGCIERNVTSRSREEILPLHSHEIVTWSTTSRSGCNIIIPQHMKDIDALERLWSALECPEEAKKILRGLEHQLWRQAEKAEVVQPREEKAPWRPCSTLPVLKEDVQGRWRKIFYKNLWW